jgi:HTH-type transcriptional regulator/antitoxin HigA
MAKSRYAYTPDYAVPPGETLEETINSLNISQAELAKRTGRPLKTINEIVKGKAAITAETALQFERALGVPASFWNNLERNYQEALAALKEQESLEAAKEWAESFPLKELVKRGAIREAKDAVAKIRALLDFFGVSSPSAWKQLWNTPEVAYRKSAAFRSSPEATAAWLRLGELEARKIQTADFDKTAFKRALWAIRKHMSSEPVELKALITDECRKAGVAVIFVSELPNTCIHGAVRWIGNSPVVQLSCRHKVEDIFWFSFFHEAGHVLLHGKRSVFLEGNGSTDEKDKEQEADRFASTLLIPDAQWNEFVSQSKLTEDSVRQFAEKAGVPTAIVVGRLQHEKYVPFSRLNHLRRRFDLTEVRAA